MRRAMIVWAGLGLMLVSAGCTMCSHPYDYCGPVVCGSCTSPCDPRTRTGSVLGGGEGLAVADAGQVVGQPMAGQEVVDEGVAGPALMGQPGATRGEAIQEGVLVPDQAAPAAGARRYPRTRLLK